MWLTDWGKWRPLMREYRELLISMYSDKDKRKRGASIAASYTGKISKKTELHTSFRNPAVDERVYRMWGKEGYVVRNVFHDYGIEYIIAAQMKMHYIGSTVNKGLIILNKKFLEMHRHLIPEGIKIEIFLADACDLPDDNNSVDLIWSSPPYYGAEVYPTDHPHEMSQVGTYEEFLKLYSMAAKEIYRILRPNRYAIIQIGDTREQGEYVFQSGDTVKIFKEAGFKLHDVIIMVNRSPNININITRTEKKRYTIMSHEYLFVFKKI